MKTFRTGDLWGRGLKQLYVDWVGFDLKQFAGVRTSCVGLAGATGLLCWGGLCSVPGKLTFAGDLCCWGCAFL